MSSFTDGLRIFQQIHLHRIINLKEASAIRIESASMINAILLFLIDILDVMYFIRPVFVIH